MTGNNGYVGHLDLDAARAQVQLAQDMLNGAVEQRNAAENRCLQLAAEIQALNRQLEQKNAEIAKKDDEIAQLHKDLDGPLEPELPLKNGGDGHAEHRAG